MGNETHNAQFEEWFAAIWAGSDNIPVPEWQKPGWDEYIEKRQLALGAWDAALSTPPSASMSVTDAVQAEIVGKVRQRRGVHGDFDGFDVDWLLEGGIHAVGIDGDCYLYVLDIPPPEDGHVELFARPAPQSAPAPGGEAVASHPALWPIAERSMTREEVAAEFGKPELAWQNIETAESEFLTNLADKGGLDPLAAGMLRHCARLLFKRAEDKRAALQASHSGNGDVICEDPFFASVDDLKHYIRELEMTVHQLTGDEGEDDALTVLKHYVANLPAPQSAQAPGGEAVASHPALWPIAERSMTREEVVAEFGEPELAWQNIETAESEFLTNLADKGGLDPLVAGMLRHCARLLHPAALPADGVRGLDEYQTMRAAWDKIGNRAWHEQECSPGPASEWFELGWKAAREYLAALPAGTQRRGDPCVGCGADPGEPCACPAGTQGEEPAEATAAPVGDAELTRLRAIEHHLWHVLDNAEDLGDSIGISRADPDHIALDKLLPEAHPTTAPGGEVREGGEVFVTFRDGHMHLDVVRFLKSPDGLRLLASIGGTK